MNDARRASFLDTLCCAVSTAFYLTYIPAYLTKHRKFTGAGLIGSLVGLLTFPLLPTDSGRLSCALFGGLGISVLASERAEAFLKTPDDPRIVIDEWIGMWIAMAWLPAEPAFWIASLILFRIFDVVKGAWINRLADLPGGWGIVLDDVAAGVAANGLLQLAHVALKRLCV